MRRAWSWIPVLGVLLSVTMLRSMAQSETPSGDLPPCIQRAHALDQPWIPVRSACLEAVIDDESLGALAFTALAAGDEGALYATRPFAGEVIVLRDTDGDLLPDAPSTLIDGLILPNGLAYAGGTLYITAGDTLYRWENGSLEMLVDGLPGLPTDGGYWLGGVTVHDGRVYIGIGAACDTCLDTDPDRGLIASYALDGSDRRVEMRGLLQPNDLDFVGERLFVADAAQDALFIREPGGDVQSIRIEFPAQTRPLGLAYYSGDALSFITDQVLLVESGSVNTVDMHGYTIVRVDPATEEQHAIMPSPNDVFTNMEMNLRGSGFFPHRPLDVTVSPEGWVYISITEGRILALRPFTE
ncbi:MAG: hypothetical protein U0670_19965 [Anaerolineae bacterium]